MSDAVALAWVHSTLHRHPRAKTRGPNGSSYPDFARGWVAVSSPAMTNEVGGADAVVHVVRNVRGKHVH